MTNILLIIFSTLFIALIGVFSYLALLIHSEEKYKREEWKKENMCKYCPYNIEK